MAFTYKLEHKDGTPADPPTLRPPAELATWRPGDLATWRHDPARARPKLRVIDTRIDEGKDGDPVSMLMVEMA
jgi:hypothetical protein